MEIGLERKLPKKRGQDWQGMQYAVRTRPFVLQSRPLGASRGPFRGGNFGLSGVTHGPIIQALMALWHYGTNSNVCNLHARYAQPAGSYHPQYSKTPIPRLLLSQEAFNYGRLLQELHTQRLSGHLHNISVTAQASTGTRHDPRLRPKETHE